MTYYYKVVPVDVDAERRRIRRVRAFSKKERKILLKLCDLLEAGDFEAAFAFTYEWTPAQREYVGSEIWDLLHARAFTCEPLFSRKQLEGEWAKCDKEGKKS